MMRWVCNKERKNKRKNIICSCQDSNPRLRYTGRGWLQSTLPTVVTLSITADTVTFIEFMYPTSNLFQPRCLLCIFHIMALKNDVFHQAHLLHPYKNCTAWYLIFYYVTLIINTFFLFVYLYINSIVNILYLFVKNKIDWLINWLEIGITFRS